MQFIDTTVISDNINVIQSGLYGHISKRYLKSGFRLIQPAVLLDPLIRLRLLEFLLKHLLKQSEVVI